jgi:RNA polymerase sigma-70 factor (ECF subfamily)
MSYSQSKSYHKSKEYLAQEKQIIVAAKNNPDSFRELYNAYFEPILQYVYARMDDKQMAIDVTQQAFYKAMTNLHKYEDRGLPFSSWLYRIASNEMNDFFRKNSKYRTVNLTDDWMNILSDELEDSEKTDRLTRLKQVIKMLAEAEFRLIEMRFFDKMPFQEIAEILDISENNAKVKTYRILDKMKANF